MTPNHISLYHPNCALADAVILGYCALGAIVRANCPHCIIIEPCSTMPNTARPAFRLAPAPMPVSGGICAVSNLVGSVLNASGPTEVARAIVQPVAVIVGGMVAVSWCGVMKRRTHNPVDPARLPDTIIAQRDLSVASLGHRLY